MVRLCWLACLGFRRKHRRAPLQAAGALARLGDPRGFPKVRASLDSPNAVTAIVACKQLYVFAQLDGGDLDVYEAFGRALERSERNIVGEARAQLEALGTEKARGDVASSLGAEPLASPHHRAPVEGGQPVPRIAHKSNDNGLTHWENGIGDLTGGEGWAG